MDMLQKEATSQSYRVVRSLLDELVDTVATTVEQEKLDRVLSWVTSESPVYRLLKVSGGFPIMTLSPVPVKELVTVSELSFFRDMVECTDDNVREIARMTVKQSGCARWHRERVVRVSSSVAHQVYRRRGRFADLAVKLARPRSFSSAATAYGWALGAPHTVLAMFKPRRHVFHG
ncbi:uncharacterized protein LOC135366111 [Ornithodoros turicata]|uniref:uncharacterized protein LOC135366111 n=1 Tax=Ornithodoros turicata TaxID=34597 RepID=UPI00313A3A4B